MEEIQVWSRKTLSFFWWEEHYKEDRFLSISSEITHGGDQ